jgi:hypothetical protein
MLRFRLSVVGLLMLAVPSVYAQAPSSGAQPPMPAEFSQIYHVHFTQAAPGKYADLEKFMTTPDPSAAMPGHFLILRHREGSPWDFVAIDHIGPKATVEAGRPGPARELRAWHEDTFVQGPPWDVFAKAMGIDGQGATAAVYVVSTYRGAAGHRAQLDEALQKVRAAAAKPGRDVILQHAEGGAWDSLVISRYDSWPDFAADMGDATAAQREQRAGLTRSAGLELREHASSHNDTIAVRVAVPPAK